MKIYYKKILYSIITLIVSFASFAQLPDPNDPGGGGGGPGGGDPPAPINNMIIFLAIIGIAFAFYHLQLNRKKV